MPLRITVEGSGEGEVRAGGPVVTIGRVVGNDLVVPDPRISSRHGRLIRRGEGYAYEDLASRNGSLVERDGERTVVQSHTPVPIQAGDRLLLGDLVSPVVLHITAAPAADVSPGIGATVVAARSVSSEEPGDADLRGLFRLLRDLSGQCDPDEVMSRILEAGMARFAHATSATVLLQDAQGEPQTALSRGDPRAPSRTLVKRALESREVVSYVPEIESGPESVAGLAGSVVVPLLSGDEAIGVLHVDSPTQAFTGDDLAWLGIVGTHVAASLVAARNRKCDRTGP